jgi:ribonuclease HII
MTFLLIHKWSCLQARSGRLPFGRDMIHTRAMRPPSYSREKDLALRQLMPVCGIDEAGRGPLAGPVVAAAVILDAKRRPRGIRDSKMLTADAREELYCHIMASAIVGVGVADVERIDQVNILRASLWAMSEAVRALAMAPAFALVDGNMLPSLDCPGEAIIEGDALCVSIAAASIIAKVTRDRLMIELANEFPHYGFEQHKGYCTELHLAALQSYGPTPHHRRSFAPVAACEVLTIVEDLDSRNGSDDSP